MPILLPGYHKSSIQLEGIEKFWGVRTFLVKKSYMKIQKSFKIILILYTQFLTKNVLILQNVLTSPNCILPRHSLTKCFNASILCTNDAHVYKSSINIGSIVFSHLLTGPNPTIYWDVTLHALILH